MLFHYQQARSASSSKGSGAIECRKRHYRKSTGRVQLSLTVMTLKKVFCQTGNMRQACQLALRKLAGAHALLLAFSEPRSAPGHGAPVRRTRSPTLNSRSGSACTGRFLRSQQVDQTIINPRWSAPKADQTADALGRADRWPALGRVYMAQADEHTKRKRRLIRNGYLFRHMAQCSEPLRCG
jgi:hypothetical protein